ncbi:MAG: hypothetical protein ACOCTI_07510 [Phycisphaeraceae bacterium]
MNGHDWRSWRIGVATLLLVGLVVGGGCRFKGEPAGADSLAAAGAWQPRPVAMRIYPSTRFASEEGQHLLEARLEFSDEMGDSIKAAGRLSFGLYAAAPAGGALGRELYRWQVDLLTLEDQQQHFDPVTRTYLFRLKLDRPIATTQPTTLRVSFTPAGNQPRLSESAAVPWE